MNPTRTNGLNSETADNRSFICHVCGSTTGRDELVNEVFEIEGRRVLVEKIPSKVCERCGEATFSRETTEKIRKLVHDNRQPVRKEQLDVFALR